MYGCIYYYIFSINVVAACGYCAFTRSCLIAQKVWSDFSGRGISRWGVGEDEG